MDFEDIKNIWKSALKREPFINKSQIESMLQLRSKSSYAINKIRANLKFELIALLIMYFGSMIYLVFLVQFNFKVLVISLFTLIFGMLILLVWTNLKKIKTEGINTNQIKPALIETIRQIEKYVKFNTSNLSKYIIIPMAFIVGMFMGIMIGAEEKSFLEIFLSMETRTVFILIATPIIGSAIMIPFSQFMTKRMYKDHLNELKECLKDFDEIEMY